MIVTPKENTVVTSTREHWFKAATLLLNVAGSHRLGESGHVSRDRGEPSTSWTPIWELGLLPEWVQGSCSEESSKIQSSGPGVKSHCTQSTGCKDADEVTTVGPGRGAS